MAPGLVLVVLLLARLRTAPSERFCRKAQRWCCAYSLRRDQALPRGCTAVSLPPFLVSASPPPPPPPPPPRHRGEKRRERGRRGGEAPTRGGPAVPLPPPPVSSPPPPPQSNRLSGRSQKQEMEATEGFVRPGASQSPARLYVLSRLCRCCCAGTGREAESWVRQGPR